ncbi:hypothetical protein EZS27_015897 [termite gut metagenome]|uniref:YhcG N-terminal domain-containing protein n=1 Tax=termite gut metagenome TaxID=433724 RepID=A0A5J4RS18_9ZZZZ
MEDIDQSDYKEFDDFIHAIGTEIEQAQIKLVCAANVQMLFHYWKVGHFILYNQKKLGWGGKVIDKNQKLFGENIPKRRVIPQET